MSNPFFGFLIHYKYLLIFPVAIVEGPVLTMFSGFMVSLGYLSFLPAYCILLSGDLVSDSLFYMVGHTGRDFFIRRGWFRLSEERLEKLEEHYQNHPRKTIILAKASYGVGSFFLMAAGASKMAYKEFLEYISIPDAVRTLLLLFAGYYFGSAWQHFGLYLRDYALIVLVFLAVGIYIWLYFRKRKAEEIEKRIIKSKSKPFK